jgi:predicted GIY-YIG superfamily endonuclease
MFRHTQTLFPQTRGMFEVPSKLSTRRASGPCVQIRNPSHRETATRAAGTQAKRPALLRRPPDMDLAGPVPLQRIRGFVIPDDPGVYLIHDLRGVLYAGRSICLRRRFAEHCEARGNELIALAQRSVFGRLTFSWVFVPDALRRTQLERELISWLRPPCNRAVPGGLR